MKYQRSPSLALALAVLSGGGLACVSEVPLEPAAPSRPTSWAEPAVLPPTVTLGQKGCPKGSGDPRQVELYHDTVGLTYKTVSKTHLDIVTLHDKYMMPPVKPADAALSCGPNPDPEWIKQWPSDTLVAHPPVAAWIQSRINRSYVPDLDVAYGKYREAWKAFDEDPGKKRDEALARKSFYERVQALRAVLDAGLQSVEALPGGKGVHPGGLHAIATSLVDEYRKANVGWALSSSGTRTGQSLRSGAFAGLRAWGDEAAEKKQFAALAMTGAVPQLIAPLPLTTYVATSSAQTGTFVNAWLRWPEDVDIAAADTFRGTPDGSLAARPAAPSVAVAYPSKPIEDPKAETREAILQKATKEEPKLVRVQGLVVAIDAIREGGSRVTLEVRDEDAREQRATERRFTVTASAWPKEVDAGDWVEVTGDLESVQVKGAPKSATVAVAVTARFVGCFQKGDPLDPKAKDYRVKLLGATKVGGVDCSLATW